MIDLGENIYFLYFQSDAWVYIHMDILHPHFIKLSSLCFLIINAMILKKTGVD